MNTKRLNVGVVTAALLLACAARAGAATRAWIGPASGLMSVAVNWTPNGVPAATDDLVVPAGSTPVDDIAALTVKSIAFSGAAGGTTISASPSTNVITVTNGITDASTSGTNSINPAITLGASQTFTLPVAFSLGAIALGSYTLTIDSATSTGGGVNINDVVSGTGALVTKGAGNVTLQPGASNTFTGGTTVSAGTLVLYALNLGAGAIVTVPGPLVIDAGATVTLVSGKQLANSAHVTNDGILDIGLNSQTLGSLSGSGMVSNTNGTLIVGMDNSDTTFSGAIMGSNELAKVGTGKLTLSGASDSIVNTDINGGTLIVTGSLGSAQVLITDANLAGSGSIAGNVIGNSGTLAPGVDGPGILSTHNVSLNTTMSFAVDLNGATVGTGYDQLTVTGTVALHGTLSVTVGGLVTVGDKLTVISNDGSDAVTGTFTGLAEGATINAGGATMTISYAGGDGNDVVLTATAVTPVDMAGAGDLAMRAGSDLAIAPADAALPTLDGGDGGKSASGCGCEVGDAPSSATASALLMLLCLTGATWRARAPAPRTGRSRS